MLSQVLLTNLVQERVRGICWLHCIARVGDDLYVAILMVVPWQKGVVCVQSGSRRPAFVTRAPKHLYQ